MGVRQDGRAWQMLPASSSSRVVWTLVYRLKRHLKLSVEVTGHPEILAIEGQITQGSSSGRTVGGSVGGIFESDSSDWLNGIRCYNFGTRPDTEFKTWRAIYFQANCPPRQRHAFDPSFFELNGTLLS